MRAVRGIIECDGVPSGRDSWASALPLQRRASHTAEPPGPLRPRENWAQATLLSPPVRCVRVLFWPRVIRHGVLWDMVPVGSPVTPFAPPTSQHVCHQSAGPLQQVCLGATGTSGPPTCELTECPVHAACAPAGPHLCHGLPLGRAQGIIDRIQRPSKTMQVAQTAVKNVHPLTTQRNAMRAVTCKCCTLRLHETQRLQIHLR